MGGPSSAAHWSVQYGTVLRPMMMGQFASAAVTYPGVQSKPRAAYNRFPSSLSRLRQSSEGVRHQEKTLRYDGEIAQGAAQSRSLSVQHVIGIGGSPQNAVRGPSGLYERYLTPNIAGPLIPGGVLNQAKPQTYDSSRQIRQHVILSGEARRSSCDPAAC